MGGFQKTTCSFQITVRLSKTHCSPYKFKKKNVLSKSGRSGALLGLNFRFFYCELRALNRSMFFKFIFVFFYLLRALPTLKHAARHSRVKA
jgi:hypothetical protein